MTSELKWLQERDPAPESTTDWAQSPLGVAVHRRVLERIASDTTEVEPASSKRRHSAMVFGAAAALVMTAAAIPVLFGIGGGPSTDAGGERAATNDRQVSPVTLSPFIGIGDRLTVSDNAAVPSLVGVSEPDALKTLETLGLAAEVRYTSGSSSDIGTVIGTDPPAGTAVSEGAAIIVEVAGTPEDIDEETDARQLALKNAQAIVDSSPDSFVGHYVDQDTLVVVLNPDVPEQDWASRFNEAVTPVLEVRFTSCDRSGVELETILEEIAARDWSPNAAAIPIGLRVNPSECAVHVAGSDLTDDDVATLSALYGDAVIFDRTATPSRLPLPGG